MEILRITISLVGVASILLLSSWLAWLVFKLAVENVTKPAVRELTKKLDDHRSDYKHEKQEGHVYSYGNTYTAQADLWNSWLAADLKTTKSKPSKRGKR